MRRHESHAIVLLTLLMVSIPPLPLCAQQPPPTASPQQTPLAAPAPVTRSLPSYPPDNRITIPAGTRVPLVLRNAVDTRTAKAGDSVYLETIYLIAVNNRMAIPMGTFVRGEILLAKRPGRIRGRGELRLALEQRTYPSGYTIELRASPNSVDANTGSGVNEQNTIEGPSSSLRDAAAVPLTAAGGAYIGTLSGAVSNDAPGKGALIGGGIGGMMGLVAVLATRGPDARLPPGTMLDVVLDRPLLLDAALLPSAAGPGSDPEPRYVAAPVDLPQQETRRNQPPCRASCRFCSSLCGPSSADIFSARQGMAAESYGGRRPPFSWPFAALSIWRVPWAFVSLSTHNLTRAPRQVLQLLANRQQLRRERGATLPPQPTETAAG